MPSHFAGWPCVILALASLSFSPARLAAASADQDPRPAWFPAPAKTHVQPKIGMIFGAQYWVNPDATPASIDADFRRMAREDQINGARLAFWTLPVGQEPDFTRFDACFKAAARYGIKLNPVLPQVGGWIDGRADQPAQRKAFKEHIQRIIRRYKDEPALAMWTIDIEPSRSWKVDPCTDTLALYRHWLPSRYPSVQAFARLNWGAENARQALASSFDQALPINGVSKGGWNNFQGFNDWLTFTAWDLAEQDRFIAEAVREVDSVHPLSSTPPDVLHNQLAENGRNMWWLADVIDYPGQQMHAHWHLEMADMPRDVLAAQACCIRKVYCSARGRAASYSGEVLGGPDLGESTRIYAPTARELMGTALAHLGEGSKGFFLWLWNPLKDGPNAGAWSVREVDGSPSEKSILLAHYGRMVAENNDLLYTMRPAAPPAAIFDSMDAAIYLFRRSSYHPMSEWFAKNQYGFFRALRLSQIGCDFIDEVGLEDGTAQKYAAIYVPFAMVMTERVGRALSRYVEQGGTIIVDAMTGFTPPNHLQYAEQPGAGLAKVLGVKPLQFELAYDGWTEVARNDQYDYFDRFLSTERAGRGRPLFDKEGKPTPLVAAKFMQPVRTQGAEILYRDDQGRPVITVNRFGKGRALWVGTLLGLTCRDFATPNERVEAVAGLVRPYLPKPDWRIEVPPATIITRQLSGPQGDVFVLFNENREQAADFKLDAGRTGKARELLWPETPVWKAGPDGQLSGRLKPLEGTVIYYAR